jgi:NAD(P)-dependent dehydrogenase (short-subunit alcohol dehydrogenase family)
VKLLHWCAVDRDTVCAFILSWLLQASVNKSAYVASKHGIVGMTKAIALETAGSGITVNAICPGWVLTPLVQTQIDARAAATTGKTVEEAARSLLIEKQPSGEDDLFCNNPLLLSLGQAMTHICCYFSVIFTNASLL